MRTNVFHTQCCRVVGRLGVEIALALIACGIGLVGVVAFAAIEPLAFFSAFFSGSVFVSVLSAWVAQRMRQVGGALFRARHLARIMTHMLVLQGVMVFAYPLSSLVPISMLERFGAVQVVGGDICDIDVAFEETKKVFGTEVAYERITIVEGGMPRTLHLLERHGVVSEGTSRLAVVFGETVYLRETTPCPSVDLWFHEMTHIWQFQRHTHLLFGIAKVPFWIRQEYLQTVNPHVLYDYGGVEGLREASRANKTIFDFNIEQQAMIVEDYFFLTSDAGMHLFREDGDEYRELLGMYVDQIAPLHR